MMTDLDTFRTETRAWLEANCPPEMREPVRSEKDAVLGRARPVDADARRRSSGWTRMGARGWTVPDWPKAYGGGGLSPAETKILREEMARDPRAQSAQQLRHLDARAGAAEIRHRGAEARAPAQDRARRNPLVPGLFASPTPAPTSPASPTCGRGRGRPLSSSTARRSGPAMPTRPTGSSASSAPTRRSKQGGISFVLFDMASEGVSTKPILLISGYSPFCETFFDNVKVPKAQPRPRREQGLGRRQISARPRARDDLGHGPGRQPAATR